MSNPSTSFSFGSPSNPSTQSNPIGFSFGAQPTPQSAPTGGFSFSSSSKTSTPQSSISGTSSNPQSSQTPSFSFGELPKAPTSNSAKLNSGTSTTKPSDSQSTLAPNFTQSSSSGFSLQSTGTSSGFSFGSQSTTQQPSVSSKVSEPATSQNTTTPSALSKRDKEDIKSGGNSTFGPFQSSTQPNLPSDASNQPKLPSSNFPTTEGRLNNRTLEQVINEWTSDLEKDVKLFRSQANQVEVWDKELISNNDKIKQLHTEVKAITDYEKELEDSLEKIGMQQQELNQVLMSLEEEVERKWKSTELNPTDIEREKGYEMAEKIDSDLTEMEKKLKALIETLNAPHSSSEEADNPVLQVVNILNYHLNALQLADRNIAQLQMKVQETSQLLQERQKNVPKIGSLY